MVWEHDLDRNLLVGRAAHLLRGEYTGKVTRDARTLPQGQGASTRLGPGLIIVEEVLRRKVARRRITRLGDDQTGEAKDRQRSSKAQHC